MLSNRLTDEAGCLSDYPGLLRDCHGYRFTARCRKGPQALSYLASKDWALRSRSENAEAIGQLLADSFHVVRTAATLLHPITPEGCEKIRQYLGIDERLWDWKYIFEPLAFFIKTGHKCKFLAPRVDFFKRHDSQFDGPLFIPLFVLLLNICIRYGRMGTVPNKAKETSIL